MNIDPLYIFVFAGLFSPGPNVILLTASGARFGFRPTLPHVLGVAAGVGVTSGLTGFGIGALLLAQPTLALALKLIAVAWIMWMAWKLFRSRSGPQAKTKDRPFTFIEAVLFQWVNPKVWAVALAASAGYSSGLSPSGEAIRLATAFSGINLFVCLFWSYAGSLLTYLLRTPQAWQIFTTVMALALAASAVMVFLS
ncbi:LysE family translocator [uncultured Litoreibacter sp.]|uniref:LysE family translocator n=1 Tax=uncultured Litoreibacter sp. TaxID=1392394 RepID=UPI00260577B2|nr:LysE family translocator [uncultured Litoreibacter sp.]